MQFHELILQKYDTVNYLQQKSQGVFRMEKKMPAPFCLQNRHWKSVERDLNYYQPDLQVVNCKYWLSMIPELTTKAISRQSIIFEILSEIHH